MEEERMEELLKKDKFERLLEIVRAIYKFRLFFIALVFSILSFSMQFSIATKILWIKICEFFAWFFLIGSGLLALRNAGGFSSRDTEENITKGLSCIWRKIMWGLFLLGIIFLAVARIGVSIMEVANNTAIAIEVKNG